MTDLEKLVERITACATTVHENMGPGFPEKHYQEAMIKEMTRAKVVYTTKEARDGEVEWLGPNGGVRMSRHIAIVCQNVRVVLQGRSRP